MPELRSDKLTDTWVILAEERSARPREFGIRAEARKLEGPCPFCEGNEAMTPPESFAIREQGAADGPGWRVRVVPNKFPALAGPGNAVATGHVLRRMDAAGSHEVVVEVPQHARPFRERSPREWSDLAFTLQHRLRALARDPRVEYVLAMKNAGPASGASLSHPHSQILALPVVPHRVQHEARAFAEHERLAQHCLLEDMLGEERDAKTRVIEEREGFLLLAPWAARFPYEMLLAPLQHAARFEDASPQQVEAFGIALGRALARLEATLHGRALESYHFALHTAPPHGKRPYHWHCEVMPSLSFHAGLEKGTGMFLNHLGPERSAEQLRRAL